MTRSYSLYSCRLTVDAWPGLLAAIHGRLEPFEVDAPASCELAVSFAESKNGDTAAGTPPSDGRRVYDFPGGHVAYDDARDRLTITAGTRIRAVCEAGAGYAHVTVASPSDEDVWLLSHPVLSLVLLEMLKRQGFFPVHAAGVALDGRGVLLAGTSGAGKSTLAVALVRDGLAFLSDDTVFLESGTSGWRVRAFPDQVDLCEDAVGMFPELEGVVRGGSAAGWPKWQVRPEHVYDVSIPTDMAPAVLIFPAVCRTSSSVLRSLAPAEALIRLAPNVLLTDAGTSQQHLDALAGLVGQCACYRLDTGRDLDEAVRIIRGALAS